MSITTVYHNDAIMESCEDQNKEKPRFLFSNQTNHLQEYVVKKKLTTGKNLNVLQAYPSDQVDVRGKMKHQHQDGNLLEFQG